MTSCGPVLDHESQVGSSIHKLGRESMRGNKLADVLGVHLDHVQLVFGVAPQHHLLCSAPRSLQTPFARLPPVTAKATLPEVALSSRLSLPFVGEWPEFHHPPHISEHRLRK